MWFGHETNFTRKGWWIFNEHELFMDNIESEPCLSFKIQHLGSGNDSTLIIQNTFKKLRDKNRGTIACQTINHLIHLLKA